MDTEYLLAESLSEPSLYEILGVPKDAPLKRIRSNYVKSVLQCHPDRVRDDALKEQRMYEFYQVQWAYEILRDESHRRHYDEILAQLLADEKRRALAKPSEAIFPTYDEQVDLAELLADEKRRTLAKPSKVIFPTSKGRSSEYRPQYRDIQHNGPLSPPLATRRTPSRFRYHGEIPPGPQSRPRPPRRRLSVYPNRGPSSFSTKATSTADQRMAPRAQEGTGMAPKSDGHDIEDKENRIVILRKAGSPQSANRGAFLGVEGVINGITVHALADTGAHNNFMNEHFSQELHLEPIHFSSNERPSFVMGHGGKIEAIGKVWD